MERKGMILLVKNTNKGKNGKKRNDLVGEEHQQGKRKGMILLVKNTNKGKGKGKVEGIVVS